MGSKCRQQSRLSAQVVLENRQVVKIIYNNGPPPSVQDAGFEKLKSRLFVWAPTRQQVLVYFT